MVNLERDSGDGEKRIEHGGAADRMSHSWTEGKRSVKEAVQFGGMRNQVHEDWKRPMVCFFA